MQGTSFCEQKKKIIKKSTANSNERNTYTSKPSLFLLEGVGVFVEAIELRLQICHAAFQLCVGENIISGLSISSLCHAAFQLCVGENYKGGLSISSHDHRQVDG